MSILDTPRWKQLADWKETTGPLWTDDDDKPDIEEVRAVIRERIHEICALAAALPESLGPVGFLECADHYELDRVLGNLNLARFHLDDIHGS